MFVDGLIAAVLKPTRDASRGLPLFLVVSGLMATACLDLNTSTGNLASLPAITTQPTPQRVTVGDPATFGVVATGDSLTYQWYKGSSLISGATSKTLTISSTVLSDAGLYQVLVANSAAILASDTVRLDVIVPQRIVAYRLIGGTATSTNDGYTSTTSDESAVFVSGGGDLTLINPNIIKSANATSPTASQSSGSNSALLANAGSRVTMIGGSVSTDSAGATGVFATGAGTSIAIFRGAVSTTGALSYGVVATLGATVRLDHTTIHAASGTLVSATGSSNVLFLADADTLVGRVIADASSTISAALQNGAKLTGAVQGIALSIDSTSTWSVTATSVLTTLNDVGGISGSSITNIVGNGFTVYYSASLVANAALGGKTYSLVGGGSLVPQ